MSLSQMLQDYKESNDYGKQDMFEEAAERMVTAEKALVYKDETIARLTAKLDAAREALQGIDKLTTEWDANKLGDIHIQRKRWQRCGDIARFVLAKFQENAPK